MTQLLSEWLTAVAFIEAQTPGSPTAFADLDAIYRLQGLTLVRPVGLAQSEVQWVAVGVNRQMAFEAANTASPRETCLIFAPFFDFTTLASWQALFKLILPLR